MMGWIRVLAVVPVLMLLFSGFAGAVPEWTDSGAPDSVGSYHESDCDTPSDCLEKDDDKYLEARDHTVQGSTPIMANRTDPLSSSDVLHDVHVRVKIKTEANSEASIQVWDGSGFKEVGSTNSNSETWVNNTVTATIQKSDGKYPVRVVPNSLAGGKVVSVDYLHVDLDHTKVGSLSYSTGNGDNSPVLGSDSIETGDTTSVSSKTVCSGGYCGQVDSMLRANGSSIGNTGGLSLSNGNNPQTATLCDGDPDSGSCSTAEMSTSWDLKGEEAGAYGIDVKSTSDYSSNGVNEPESSESVLKVIGGSLSTSITSSKSSVLEGQSFQVDGEVTCKASNGCKGVSLDLQDGAGSSLGSGTTPFATPDTNPKDCGDLSDTETCRKSWEVEATGDGTNDYDIQVEGSSSDSSISSSTSSTTVTVEAPSVSVSRVSQSGSSSSLSAGFDYSSNVDATVTCQINSGESCSKTVGSTGGSTTSDSCGLGAPSYQSDNSIKCTIENSTYGVSDSSKSSFSVSGSLGAADTQQDVVNPGDSVTVYCPIQNTGGIQYDGGKSSKDYSRLQVALNGPEGETVQQSSTDPTLQLGADSSKTEEEQLTVPSDGSEGEWTAICSDYELIDSISLASGPKKTTFNVSGNESEELSLDILSPNPRDTYYTGEGEDVVVAVENSNGNSVTGATVTVNGKSMNDEGKGADSEAGDARYSRRIIIPDTENSYNLKIKAEKNGKTGSVSTVLSVQDGFRIGKAEVKDSYTIGDTVRLNGTVVMRRESRNTTAKTMFVAPDGTVTASRTASGLSDGSFVAEFILKSDSPTGVWQAAVEVSDDYDRDTETVSFEVQPPNPGAFYLNFLSPDRSTFRPGDAIRVEVRPESSRTGNTVSLEGARCKLKGVETSLQPAGSVYEGRLVIPRGFTPGSYTVSCRGERLYEGETKTSTNSFSITVESIPLEIEVMEPASGVVNPGENVSLKVNVTRGGRPAANASIEVLLDGRNTSMVLRKSGTPGIYQGTVTVPERAESIRLRAVDQFGNTGESDPVTVRAPGQGFNTRLFAMYAAIFFVASLIIYGAYRRYLYEPPLERQAKEKRRKLQSVEESIQDTQRDYFNRKIDEDTYRRMMQKYEKEKTQLENELDGIMRELEKEES